MDTRNLKQILNNCAQPYVLILVGPPLSGKDTVLKKLNLDAKVISRDSILLETWGSDNYDEAFKGVNQKEVDKRLNKLLKEVGESDDNAIINMTNMRRKRRKYNLSFFPNHNKVAVILPLISNEEYERRDKKRRKEEKKSIPLHVFKSMVSSYQNVDKKEEGFDKVISL